MQQCRSLGRDTWHIGGYIQTGMGSERTWPTCTCAAYKFSKTIKMFGSCMVKPPCKHIKEIQKTRCNWCQISGIEQTPEQKEKHICPVCGGKTEVVSVMV